MPSDGGEEAGREIRAAGLSDVPEMLALQAANLPAAGGALSVAFPSAWFEAVVGQMPVMIARRGGVLVGYLVASRDHTRGQALVEAKWAAWPGAAGAYNAGPLCVAAGERGRGLGPLLMDAQRRALPGREAVAFARQDNAASRAVHAKAGYREVASFTHAGVAHVVLVRPG